MSHPVGADLSSAIGRIVVAPDGDEFVLGRPDLNRYVVVPAPGAVLVEALQAGDQLPTATARASEAAGEPVDGADFLAGLAAAGLLASEDGESVGTDPTAPAASTRRPMRHREIRWISAVSPAAARRLFGPVAWSGYALATAFVAGALLARPDLRPSYEHIWWLPDPVLSVLLLFPFGLLLAGCHEAWHWLAGRAVGIPARFRVSYRGVFLVFETDLSQLVTLPRRRRYGAFLAGMAFDVSVLAAALALRLANRVELAALPGWLDRLLAAVVLAQVMRIGWQWAALFLRSDGYAVLATALGCHDLYRATWLTTKDRLWGMTGAEAAEYAGVGARDRQVAQWFGVVFLAGLIGMGWLLVAFALPFLIGMLAWVGHNLVNPTLASVAFWQSVAVVLVIVGQYAVVPLLAWRERRLRRAGVLR